MPPIPMLSLPIVIDATNKWLDFSEGGGAEESFSMTEGTYADIYALLTEVQAKVSVGISGFTATLELPSAANAQTDPVYVRFNADNLIQCLCHTGTHGYHGTNTSAWSKLGFLTSADSSNSDEVYSDHQPYGVWYPGKPVAVDVEDGYEVYCGDPHQSADGTVRVIVEMGERRVNRNIRFDFVAPTHTRIDCETGALTNTAFERVWLEIAAGQYFRWWDDASVSATYADYYWSGERSWHDCVHRRRELKRYNIEMLFDRKET